MVRDLIKDHHLFSVEDVVLAMKLRMDPTTLGPERLDPYERDDIDLSRTLIEEKLSPTMRERIRVRYDHLDDFFDIPGSVIFVMSLDICNASQSFDIEGALENLERLTLDDYPGEDVTEYGAIAQKYIKSMQGGCALPVKTGSKILYKFTKTSCEKFNRKIFTKLDETKAMEQLYKLQDPKAVVTDHRYNTLGPFGLISWIQRQHAGLVKDREWPALVAKLPQSNVASASIRVDTRTCHGCGKKGQILPYCPDNKNKHTGGKYYSRTPTHPSSDGGGERTCKPLASWKYIEPKNITKAHVDENKQEWKVCTKCACKATKKQDFFI
jgi:hypothetical protein